MLEREQSRAREQWLALAGAGVAFVLAFVIVWSVGLPDTASDGSASAPVVGAAAPSFIAQNEAGTPLTLVDLRGGPVLLNFWATWCEPCQVELPDLQQLYEDQQAGGVRVVAVNVNEPPAVFLPWAAARGLTFDLVSDSDGAIQQAYQVRGTPQTFIIDTAGVIQAIFYGPVALPRLERALLDIEVTQNQP